MRCNGGRGDQGALVPSATFSLVSKKPLSLDQKRYSLEGGMIGSPEG
jgi:hypothetical protein